jgi:hypothetical protein
LLNFKTLKFPDWPGGPDGFHVSPNRGR